MLELVTKEMSAYVSDSIRSDRLSDQAAALVRLFKGTAQNRIVTLAFEAAGPEGAAWTGDSAAVLSATNFMMRQGGTIGGGTTEMARNVISERVLHMPRERRLDTDVPFRDVPRSRSAGT
jgi:alkylation response protein AidB-like acyl-CoA dehydrogenase